MDFISSKGGITLLERETPKLYAYQSKFSGSESFYIMYSYTVGIVEGYISRHSWGGPLYKWELQSCKNDHAGGIVSQ